MYRWKIVLSDGNPKHTMVIIEIPEAKNSRDARKLVKEDMHYKAGRKIIKSVTKIKEVLD
jgi:hypothetical protein